MRRALRSERPPRYSALSRKSKLDPYKDYLKLRLEDGVTNAVKLLREIKARGYTGKISILRDFLLPLKRGRQRQAWLRFETMAGKQAQADWAHFSAQDVAGRLTAQAGTNRTIDKGSNRGCKGKDETGED